jgi:hypothetical protein
MPFLQHDQQVRPSAEEMQGPPSCRQFRDPLTKMVALFKLVMCCHNIAKNKPS